ncbi:MAG: hypothetical protein GY710_12870 [Desulfobacteraceae bacterium]|nr:hypothetical protein [Desulfobacteraceae bacterium]
MKSIFNTQEYLIFTIEKIQFGIKTNLVSKIIPLDQIRQEKIKVCWFHEKIGFYKKKVLYQTPMVLRIKGKQKPMGIVIDQPKDILKIFKEEIYPLPQLIRRHAGTTPIESVAMKDNTIILLMDMDHLLTH